MKSKSVKSRNIILNSSIENIEYVPVSLLRLFMSILYDFLLSSGIAIGYTAIAVAVHVSVFGVPIGHEKIQWYLLEKILFCTGLVAVLLSYFVYCWVQKGQTLGMKTWRIKVIDAKSHQLISLQTSLIRATVALFSLLLLGAGFWLRYFHSKQRTWHDLASHSQIILLKKN